MESLDVAQKPVTHRHLTRGQVAHGCLRSNLMLSKNCHTVTRYVQAGKGVGHPPGNDPVRYLHPFRFSEDRTPSRIFGLWHPRLIDSKFFSREAKIDEILMKIAEIEVLFTIFGYISLFLTFKTQF